MTGVTRSMRKNAWALGGTAMSGLLLVLATGCVTVSGAAPAQQGGGAAGRAAAGAATHPDGPLPGLRYSEGGTARMTSTPPPASAALPGANDVLATGAAASGATTLLAAADSGIWRSADSGATWRRVLAGIRAWSLAALPGGGYAALGVQPGANAAASGQGEIQPELATSADGTGWHVMKVPAPSAPLPFGYGYRFALSGTGAGAVGVAVPDPGETMLAGSAPAYRTADGGRHWMPLPPAGTKAGGVNGGVNGGVAMLPDGRTFFVTAPGNGSGCQGAVYESRDGGATWALLPGSCQQYPLQDVQFTSAADGFAVGGRTAQLGGGQVVEATTDGGRSWATRTRPETTQTLRFAGAGGHQLWFTSTGALASTDGGRHWSPVPSFPAPLAAQPAGVTWQAAPPSALLGYDEGSSRAWASGDGGRTWTASTVPGGAANPVLAVALGGGGAAYAVTGPGADCLSPAQVKKVERLKPGWTPPAGASVLYASSDGGVRWNASGLVLPFGVQAGAAMAASGTRIAIIDACGRLELSGDAGAHWTAQPLGAAPICTVSVLGSELWLDCLAGGTALSLHSADGGATWLAYRLPALAGSAPGIFATGPGSAVLPIGGALWRTSDGGKSWARSWPLSRCEKCGGAR